jgi:uncharacterized membrane protein YcaP (DUF421 family)
VAHCLPSLLDQKLQLMQYWYDLLIIVGKSSLIYVFIVGAIRLFGKKELAQLSVIDLVFILLISNAVQNAMVGNDNTVQGGIAAALGLFIVNYALKIITYRFSSVSKMVQGEAIMLVYDGKMIEENMRKALITKEEVEAAIREHGVAKCSEVDLAIMEVDGNISVISDNYARKSVRKRRAHKVLRQQD